jgi:hypothetical protein
MIAHPTLMHDYLAASLDESLRRAEAAAAARETRTTTRRWPLRTTRTGRRHP